MSAKYRKVYGGDGVNTTMKVKKDELNWRDVPVEKKLTREELEHLHMCIRFTKEHKKEELEAMRLKQMSEQPDSELVADIINLGEAKKKLENSR